jgi:hypothetical protein
MSRLLTASFIGTRELNELTYAVVSAEMESSGGIVEGYFQRKAKGTTSEITLERLFQVNDEHNLDWYENPAHQAYVEMNKNYRSETMRRFESEFLRMPNIKDQIERVLF